MEFLQWIPTVFRGVSKSWVVQHGGVVSYVPPSHHALMYTCSCDGWCRLIWIGMDEVELWTLLGQFETWNPVTHSWNMQVRCTSSSIHMVWHTCSLHTTQSCVGLCISIAWWPMSKVHEMHVGIMGHMERVGVWYCHHWTLSLWLGGGLNTTSASGCIRGWARITAIVLHKWVSWIKRNTTQNKPYRVVVLSSVKSVWDPTTSLFHHVFQHIRHNPDEIHYSDLI